MNSSIEEILDFKCCNLSDMNLEFHVRNNGNKQVNAPRYLILKNDKKSLKIDYLYPPWEQIIAPGDMVALYCHMDENIWKKYDWIIIEDNDGTEACFPITHDE